MSDISLLYAGANIASFLHINPPNIPPPVALAIATRHAKQNFKYVFMASQKERRSIRQHGDILQSQEDDIRKQLNDAGCKSEYGFEAWRIAQCAGRYLARVVLHAPTDSVTLTTQQFQYHVKAGIDDGVKVVKFDYGRLNSFGPSEIINKDFNSKATTWLLEEIAQRPYEFTLLDKVTVVQNDDTVLMRLRTY